MAGKLEKALAEARRLYRSNERLHAAYFNHHGTLDPRTGEKLAPVQPALMVPAGAEPDEMWMPLFTEVADIDSWDRRLSSVHAPFRGIMG